MLYRKLQCSLSSLNVLLVSFLFLILVSPCFSLKTIFFLYTPLSFASWPSIFTSPISLYDTCPFKYLKKVVDGVCLVVNYNVQVTSSSMRLIKLLPTIKCRGNKLLLSKKTSPTTHDSLTSTSPSHLELLKAFCLFISPSRANSLLGRMMLHCQHYSPTIPSSVLKTPQVHILEYHLLLMTK